MALPKEPHIGDKVRFKPSAWTLKDRGAPCDWDPFAADVTGVIDYINEKHRLYRITYVIFGKQQHECFKY